MSCEEHRADSKPHNCVCSANLFQAVKSPFSFEVARLLQPIPLDEALCRERARVA
jgi:hypothetical protein